MSIIDIDSDSDILPMLKLSQFTAELCNVISLILGSGVLMGISLDKSDNKKYLMTNQNA